MNQKRRPIGGECVEGFHPQLGWSHYRALMRVENEQARSFYEIEATRTRWNKNQLERQINSLLFEAVTCSKNSLAPFNEGFLKQSVFGKGGGVKNRGKRRKPHHDHGGRVAGRGHELGHGRL